MTIKEMMAAWKSYRHYKRCRRAIAEADRRKLMTRKKQLVLVWAGRPVVISKEDLKEQIRAGRFRRGFNVAKAESLAIYKTL